MYGKCEREGLEKLRMRMRHCGSKVVDIGKNNGVTSKLRAEVPDPNPNYLQEP